MRKKKIGTIILTIIAIILGVGSVIAWKAYQGVGTYILGEVVNNQITQGVQQQIGIDLAGPDRPLTDEEIESLQNMMSGQAQQPAVEVGGSVETTVGAGTGAAVESEQGATQNPPAKPTVKVPTTTHELKQALEEQAQAIISQVPAKDRTAMTNLIVSNLSMSEITYLAGLALDGVSSADIAIAKQTALDKFDTQELEVVRGYYYRYRYLIP